MNRRPHRIRENHGSELPDEFVFFDTETRESPQGGNVTELVFLLGTGIYWRRERDTVIPFRFDTRKKFWDEVNNRSKARQTLYLIAHNVGFDFRVLKGFEWMKRKGFRLEKIIYNQSSNVWTFRNDRRTIYVLDNMNFFKGTLSSLGESIGIPKLTMPEASNRDAIFAYCENDTRIVFEAWKKLLAFIGENELGNFARTIAGQAFNAYRHRFMKEKIFVHTNERATKLERESYRGGRTECFRVGRMPEDEYTVLDVNSMYPSVMREGLYPVELFERENDFAHAVEGVFHDGLGIVADVLISTNIPVFGVRKAGKLIFPVGTFRAVLTTSEFRYAVDHYLVSKFYSSYLYRMKPLFREYVDFFFGKRAEYRKEKNESFAFICKLFLNSLYGKFGQRNEVFKEVGRDPDAPDGVEEFYDSDARRNVKRRTVNGLIEESVGFKEGFESFCAIASHVTADARMKLWGLIKTAGRENVFYCDTDSLIVNRAGRDRLKGYVGNEIGMLSVKQVASNLTLFGNKDYTFGKETVRKGVKNSANELAPGIFEQDTFEGMAGAIRMNRSNRMLVTRTMKVLKRIYDKGVVLPDGRVEPHRLTFEEGML